MFKRRLGISPQERNPQCVGCWQCPDLWELDDGDFAIIGVDITGEAGKLPPTAGCGPNERMVRIPRELLVHAKNDIPDAV